MHPVEPGGVGPRQGTNHPPRAIPDLHLGRGPGRRREVIIDRGAVLWIGAGGGVVVGGGWRRDRPEAISRRGLEGRNFLAHPQVPDRRSGAVASLNPQAPPLGAIPRTFEVSCTTVPDPGAVGRL